MLNILEKFHKLEMENLYNNNKNIINTEESLENINKIIFKNINLFENIYLILIKNKRKLTSKIKNKSIDDIEKRINNILEKDAFYIFISKFILIAFNDINRNINYNNNLDLNDQILEKNTDSFHNILNKITNLIEKMSVYLIYNKEIEAYNKEEIEFFSFKIITLLINESLISSTEIKKNEKSIKLLKVENFNYIFHIELYKNEFKWLRMKDSLYLINNTIYSVYAINKISEITGNKFRIEKDEILDRLINIKFKIDKKILNIILNEYIKENKLENVNDIEIEYYNTNNELKKAIKEKDAVLVSKISQTISILYKGILFNKILKNNYDEYFYLPFILDFRGRIYNITSLSPTFCTELRYCISYGEYDNYESEKTNNIAIDNNINKLNEIFTKLIIYINDFKSLDNIKNDKNEIKISVIWILISISEIYKYELGEKIKIENMIKKSIEVVNNSEYYIKEEKDYDKKIKLIYLIYILKEINMKKYIKRTISKDATASVYQHLFKTLGSDTEEGYMMCNLMSIDTWYDTYSIIINTWINSLKLDNDEEKKIKKYFNRKTLKKTIMTEPYGVGLKKAYNYFIKDIEKINETETKELKEKFNNFFNFLKKNNITKNNSNTITEYIIKNSTLKFRDRSIIDFKYFKKNIETRKDTTINNKRNTLKLLKFSDILDEEKSKIASRANYIHALDAALVREILKWIKIISIHDCFLVDYLNITKFIAIANFCINIDFHKIHKIKKKKFFSPFVMY